MAELSRRSFVKLGIAAAIGGPAFLAACSKGVKRKSINFFNWFAYIGKNTIPGFEKESGIKVNYDVYSSEDEMFSKLKAGVQGYDLVVATDFMIPKLKTLQLIAPMPTDRLKNIGNIAERFRDPIYDPGLAYTVPYLWGTTGIGYNKSRLPKSPSSWWDLWDPKYKGRMTMLDNQRDAIGCALILLGLPPDSGDPEHLKKARDLLVRQRGLLKQYSSTTYIDDLASGDLWLAQGWSGDVLQASRENKQVDYIIPQEGSFIWADSLCLLRGSESREDVIRFIDYLLRPEIAAEIANTVRYATPNAKAMPLLDSTLKQDRRVFPSSEVEKRLHFSAILDPKADELWNRIWQEVKVI